MPPAYLRSFSMQSSHRLPGATKRVLIVAEDWQTAGPRSSNSIGCCANAASAIARFFCGTRTIRTDSIRSTGPLLRRPHA